MRFGENEILEREQEMLSSKHKFVNRFRMDARCFLLLLVLVLAVMLVTCLAGMFRRIVQTAPEVGEEQLLHSAKATVIYDKDGNELQRLDGSEIRQEYVSLENISVSARNAFIAADDTGYYAHHGIDVHSIFDMFSVTSASAQQEDSTRTLTQQLIRNQIFIQGTGAAAAERMIQRIQEQYLAVTLEAEMGKDQILEYYLNTLYFGGNRVGIGAASSYYFEKKPAELTVSEAAVLAALAQDPEIYDPMDAQKQNSNKRAEILGAMLQMETITEEEYEDALGDNIYVQMQTVEHRQKGTTEAKNDYISAVISQVISDLKEQAGYSATQAYHAVYQGGLRIDTCLDSEIQKICEEEVGKQTGKDAGKNAAQVSVVFMDQSTGKVEALVGGQTGKTPQTGKNRASGYVREPGEVLEPLAVWLPALDTAGMTLGDVFDDTPYSYTEDGTARSTKASHTYQGLVTVRESMLEKLESPLIQAMEKIGVQTGYDYLKRLGITTLVDKRGDVDGNVESDLSLALARGEMADGVTGLELTAAYAVLANGGKSVSPVFYTKLEDQKGNVLLENTKEKSQIIRSSSAWLLTDALCSYVQEGEGKEASLGDGVSAAGFGGTSENHKDQWFEGYTSSYTAGIWCGNDEEKTLHTRISCAALWKKIMTRVNADRDVKTSAFPCPDDIIACNICTKCGGLAVSGLCDEALGGSTVQKEYFVSGTQPTQNCSCHVRYRICKKSGLPATENCPENQVEERVYLLKEEETETEDSSYILPKKFRDTTCKKHTEKK